MNCTSSSLGASELELDFCLQIESLVQWTNLSLGVSKLEMDRLLNRTSNELDNFEPGSL